MSWRQTWIGLTRANEPQNTTLQEGDSDPARTEELLKSMKDSSLLAGRSDAQLSIGGDMNVTELTTILRLMCKAGFQTIAVRP